MSRYSRRKEIAYTKDRYYEAILQLRPYNLELLRFVKNKAKKKKEIIATEKHSKYGIDLKLASKRFAMSLGKSLKKHFNGEIKLSRKLHTVHRLTSRKVYRVTVLFRLEEKREDE